MHILYILFPVYVILYQWYAAKYNIFITVICVIFSNSMFHVSKNWAVFERISLV